MLKVSRQTIHRAYQELLDQKLVRRRPDKSLVITDDSRNRITGNYRVIGILLPMDFPSYVDLNERSSIPYLKGVIGRASQLNISCMMLQVPSENPCEAEIEEFLEEHCHRLYGLVHLGALPQSYSKGAVLRQIMARKDIPQVCVSGFSEFANVGSAVSDIVPAMKEACSILRQQGIKRLGIIGKKNENNGSPFTYLASSREETMRKTAVECGLEVAAEIVLEDMAEVEKLLTSSNCPEALFCHNNRIAEKVIALADKLKLQVPGDIAIFGYDLKAADDGLSRIDPKSEEVAAAAVDLICRHFDEGVCSGNRIVQIPATFIPGKTLRK